MALFYNCQKDDSVSIESNESQQNSITRLVSASEIPKVMQFLESKSNNRLEFLVDDSNSEFGINRSHEENLSITTALTDQIKMVTNSYEKSNYTFELIEQVDKTEVYFLNLIVKEYKDELYMYIVKYLPDTTWLQSHHISKDFNVFTGSIYFYSENGTYVGKLDMANGIATSGFQKHPCDGENSGNEGNNNNGNSTSGWDGGATGGNSGDSGCYFGLVWYECGGSNSNIPHGTTGPMACGVPGGSGSGWVLELICEGAIRSMRDTLRHPCDGGSNGGGTSTSSLSCETITGTTCDNIGNTLMEWDENCNCVEAQTIENSQVAVVYSDKENCKKLKALTDNSDINQKLASLISSSNNNNYEEGFRVMTYNGETQAGDITNNEGNNCAEVDIRIHQFVHTAAHSHPAGCDVLGMFSGGDLQVFARMASLYNDQDAIDTNNYQKPTFMLAYVNTVFAINFDSPSAMTNLIELFDDQKRIEKLFDNLDKEYQRSVPQGQQSANIGDLMTAFLKVLEKNNLEGLSLYQAEVNNNNQVTGWQKKIRNNNGTLGTVNCN